MSEKDKMLVEKAWKISCFEHYKIDNLIEQAESQEAKEKLRIIRNHKYHLEEYKSGLD